MMIDEFERRVRNKMWVSPTGRVEGRFADVNDNERLDEGDENTFREGQEPDEEDYQGWVKDITNGVSMQRQSPCVIQLEDTTRHTESNLDRQALEEV